jgi:hypothetical protein
MLLRRDGVYFEQPAESAEQKAKREQPALVGLGSDVDG